MKKYLLIYDGIFKNVTLLNLKLFILITPLVIYKYVDRFRTNQEAWLKLFVIIGITLWTLKCVKDNKIIWKKSKINLYIVLFILIMSLSLLISDYKMVSLKEYLIFLSYFFIYFLIINNVDKKEQFDSFIKLFFLTSFFLSLYTLIQYYGFDPYLKDLHSLTSTVGQKNWISNYLGMFFPVILVYFLLEDIKKNKIVYYSISSIIYATLMICQSRGIWISITFTILIGIFLIYRFKLFTQFKGNQKWLVLLIITFLIITIIYSTENPLNKSAITVPQRVMSTFDMQGSSLNARLLMWKTTLKMIEDKPLFGSGIGTFKINYLNYQAEFLKSNSNYIKYSGKAEEAHNEYLQIWAELGIISLGIFLLIIFVFYNLVWKFLNEEKDIKKKLISWGLILGITCFLFHSLFTFPLHVPALGSAFFILLGLTVGYIGGFDLNKINKKNEIWGKINQINQRWLKIVSIILIFVCMVFVIDFLIIKPYIAEIYYFKGARYNVGKNYDKALPNFEYAAQLDPYNGRILHALGTTYYHLNIQDEAQKILQRTKYYFNDRNIYRNLGLSYTQSGKYREAEKEFRHAIYLDPKFYNAYNDLASLYIYENEYDKAIRQWEGAIELNLEFEEKYIFLYYIGLAYNKKQMPDKALEYFLEALQLVPEGDPIEKEIEEEINKIYKSKLEN